MKLRLICATISVAGSIGGLATGAQAASTAAHAMVVSGHANGGGGFACATSGPQAREGHFFGTGVPLPTEGYAGCNLGGGIQDTSSASGTSLAHQAVTAAFDGGINVLSADAEASQGVLHVQADGTYTGETSAFSYHYGEAAAYSTDSLTQAGSGAGFMLLGFSIDGSASSTGNSQTLTYLNYQVDAGPIFSAFVAGTGGGGASRAINPTGGGGTLPGFTIVGQTVSGSGTAYTFLTPITLGTAFDLSLGLYAASYPGPFTGLANNDFFSTAKLSSIAMFDASGNPIDVSITSASGTLYDASGAHPFTSTGVPEPATWAIMLLGLGVTGAVLRRRRGHSLAGLA